MVEFSWQTEHFTFRLSLDAGTLWIILQVTLAILARLLLKA